MKQERIFKEQLFHNQRFGGDDEIRRKADKYYSVNIHVVNRYMETVFRYSKGKKLLEYGCGTGIESEKWINNGALLTGIDISSEGIKKAKEFTAELGLQADFFVMNAEKTEFPDNSFDVIAGTGIIHHLDLELSYKELSRILKAEGHAVFIEPLDHNPIIKLYRKFTPQMRTEDEHPLKIRDIRLLRKYFNNLQIEYYSLFTLLAVPFRNRKYFIKLHKFLNNIDNIILNFPLLKRYAWTTLIHASYPKKII